MIRFAVGTVLLIYFLGADVFQPYRPSAVDGGLKTFHKEVNRGTWLVVGPVVMFVKQSLSYTGGGWVKKDPK